jgi:hypothetical protein
MPATPQRKTPTKRAPRKTAAAPAPAPAGSPDGGHLTAADKAWLDQQQALAADGAPDAQLETGTEQIPDGAIIVPLGPHGDLVHILPRGQWPSSALSALHDGDTETWAQKCLYRPDYDHIWVGVDPTVDEIADMMRAWTRLTGEDPGKVQTQRGSLRNGRRR